jgi:hypothetical protein
MRYLIIFLCLVMSCSVIHPLFGMGRAPSKPSSQELKASVERFLDRITVLYNKEEPSPFITLVSSDFPNMGEFKDSLQKEFLAKKNLQLAFIVDSVLLDQGKVLVNLHWYKKFSTFSGTPVKESGSAQLLLKKTSDGLTLLGINGENPFF